MSMVLRLITQLLLSRKEMDKELADIPYGYHFIASNYYEKGKMLWKVNITPQGCNEEDVNFAAWRVLDGMNNFDIPHGQIVAVKGEAREVDET